MPDQGVLIKYNINEIFACQDVNSLMIKDLEQYCTHKNKSVKSALAELIKPMDDVTKSHNHGINPNDIILKNMIRDALNKINHNNYDNVLEDLKSLNYSCDKHFELLAKELIIKSMNDVMACKGIESSKTGQKTPSEIYMNIACEFSNYQIKQQNISIKFKKILMKECYAYFEEFTNKKERMDQNNPHRVSNYKGFMNMIGLMYSYGLFPNKIIKICFNKIVKLMLESNLPHDDCDNYYSGYDRLINRMLAYFEKDPIKKNMIEEFKEISDFIIETNEGILKACENANPKPIRKFSIVAHQQTILRFNKLCNLYENIILKADQINNNK